MTDSSCSLTSLYQHSTTIMASTTIITEGLPCTQALYDDEQDLCSRSSHSQMGIRPNKYNKASGEGQSYTKYLIHSPLTSE